MTPDVQQGDFAAALLDSSRPLPAGLAAPALDSRFDVYRNNVIKGLIDALRSRFPATGRITGEEFFDAMAQIHVRAHPPTSPVMSVFGDGFPDFVAAFPPAGDMPYLADVCRIEAARTRAYHAADATPLAANAFTALDPERLTDLRLILHPSLEVIRSTFPAFTIWAMNSDELPLAEIADWQPEDIAVARPALDVEVRKLPAGSAAFTAELRRGGTLGTAAGAALADHAGFDLATNLAGLIGAGMIVALA